MSASNRGFSLAETSIASAIMVFVLLILAASVRSFTAVRDGMACRATALTIAADRIAAAEAAGGPARVGTSFVEADGKSFQVFVSCSPDSAAGSIMTVTVTGPAGGPVTLERRFAKGTGWL
ncbi:MAG TPA: hypothetical protein PLX54_01615 [Candidatus Fermentibacter daniensis]|nr:MAG: hypothetical protein AO394_07905 [Candidatus Fermentibacter daniensis]MBP7719757.1 hypothetical protein [Candidatus Fermentibacter sp.]OQC69739.1 MAG: hypothetical protein BWX47_00968 [candidate division Hyd24-12 bacterium ADurb.Bin004]KZD15994.1 MAG: hypothetical protein AO395_05245 [Candidatus Fermentibacter daniensis]KZD19701.1 MAG: hypothetical protein AO396_08400 [Candidatus Fermentibacter daniensis]